MAKTKSGWIPVIDATKGPKETIFGDNPTIAGDTEYHELSGGVMIPLARSNFVSSGFDPNKPGKVIIDGIMTVDFAKLTPTQLKEISAKIPFEGISYTPGIGYEIHAPPRLEIANAFAELAKQQLGSESSPVSFLRRCIQAIIKFLSQ